MIIPANLDLNAPILSLLATIALALISLVLLTFRSSANQAKEANAHNKAIIDAMLAQGASTNNSLRDEVLRTQGQVEHITTQLNKATEDSIAAKLESGRLRNKLEDAIQDMARVEKERDFAHAEAAKVKNDLNALKNYVRTLIKVMKEHQIPVPSPKEMSYG